MRTRSLAVLSTIALSASLLAGCGGSSSSSSDTYCKELKAAKADFSSLGSGSADFSQFDKVIATFHKLAGDAPSEVAADWKTLDGALSTLQKDLQDAGLPLKDLGAITQGQMPPGMTQSDLASLAPKLQAAFAKLDDPKFKQASDKIEKHAKSECHVTLGTS
ncbi:MAG TPA: hypothetical protein VHO29_14300 [Marmoricola sp.]|nr:hypothetical protein [Marmoricola sp.]